MGVNFASGTTDGPGIPVSDIDFDSLREALLGPDSPVGDLVREHAKPTPEDIACHGNKSILLATGRVSAHHFSYFIIFDFQLNISR